MGTIARAGGIRGEAIGIKLLKSDIYASYQNAVRFDKRVKGQNF